MLISLRKYFFGFLFFSFSIPLFSQQADTSKQVQSDSTKQVVRSTLVLKHSPKKAATMSAILPGLGQAYNKKYWKMPLVYAGFAGLSYAVNFNHVKYRAYRDAYIIRVDSDPNTVDKYDGIYTDGNLITLQDYYHRYRDLAIIGCAALYVLNIIDASVDAHLFNFDVSDDLSMRIVPSVCPVYGSNNFRNTLTVQLQF